MKKELLKIGSAYVRVSDERQDEYSPDSQLKKIREYAEKDGYIIPDEYVFYDDGISGKNVKNREEFNRMIAMSKEPDHPFDVIYVWKLSRFARNQEQSIVYKNLLKKKGITVKSVSEPIPDGPFGKLIERIIEWMDEFYLINLGTEVTRGMTERVSRGEPVVPAPFGYLNAPKTYIPDDKSGAATIVKEIYERYANGEKQREIAILLNQRGIRTKRGNNIENRWVEYILRNPVYTGKMRWTTDGSQAIHNRDFGSESVTLYDGNWQPLITVELWDKVQKLLDEQKKAYPKYARREQPIQYMLKGLLRCSSCGGTLTMSAAVSGKAKVRTLQCHNYAKGSCLVSHSVLMPKIENAFMQGLKQAIGNKQFTIVPTQKKTQNKPSVDYDKLIAIEERKLVRAKDSYLAEIDTLEQYKQNKQEITAKIEKLKAMQEKDTIRVIDTTVFAKKVVDIVKFIENDKTSITAKNEALHTIIEKVIYDKAEENLAIYFHDI